MFVLMRKASLPVPVMVAPALLVSVMLPVAKEPDVSMARVVPVIVPKLLMTTPGDVDPPVQVIAVPVTDRAAPLSTMPVSLLVTVFAVVLLGSGGTVDTSKLAASAGNGAASATTLAARAIRLTPAN